MTQIKKTWLTQRVPALVDHALNYALRSIIPVFPCNPKNKAPLTPHGFKDASTDPEQIKRWWQRWPYALIGIPTGAVSGLFAADLDRKPGQADGVIEWPKFLAEHGSEDIETQTNETPSSGQHKIFQFAEGIRNVPLGKLWPGIEIKGEGGYIVFPPSPGYKALNNLPPAAAPQWLTDSILALQTPSANGANGGSDLIPVNSFDDDKTATRAELVAAMAVMFNHYDAWNDWNRVGMALWYASSGEACDLYDQWSKKHPSYNAKKTCDRWRAFGRSPPNRIGAGTLFRLAYEADPNWRDQIDQHVDWTSGEELTAQLLNGKEKTRVVAESEELPDSLLHPQGLVGEIAEWITATAIYPQPGLSLAAALVIVGTAAGRTFAGPTDSGTHLYVIGLAPTSSGKDHPLRQVGRILEASGMGDHLGPSEFISMPAAVNYTKDQPLSVCCMDEIGPFLKRANSKHASGFERGISGFLRTAWGASFDVVKTPAWAQTKSESIMSLALSIFGCSTKQEFYDSLSGADVSNGFIARLFLILGRPYPEEQIDRLDKFDVPESIIKQIKGIYKAHGNMLHVSSQHMRFKKLDISPNAEAVRREMQADVRRRGKENSDVEPFLGRTVEIAIRLATIVTVGQGTDCIEEDVMIWAIDLALWSSALMIKSVGAYMADSETQSMANDIREKVKKFVDRRGRAQRVQVFQALKNKYKRRELMETITLMAESGEFSLEKDLPGPKGGQPRYWICLHQNGGM